MEIIDNKINDILGADVDVRPKSILIPLICTLVGVALFGLAYLAQDANLHFGLMVCGSIVTLISLSVVLSRKLGGGCEAYYVPGQEKLRRIESFYAYESLDELQACVAMGDYESLRRIRRAVEVL